MNDIETQVENNEYVKLVWKTLESWYLKFAEFTPNLVVGILVFLFFYFSSSYLTRIAVRLFRKFFPDKKEAIVSLIGFIRFLILLIGTFISLEIMGLSGFLWKFIGSLGVAGVIAGVALKDIVSSMFSGMLVGIDKAFKVGDYVTIGTFSGTVQEIGFLTTKMVTDDGKKVYVPNQIIFNAPFHNVTASPQRNVIINFDIPADEDIQKAISSIKNAISKIDKANDYDSATVIITNLKDGLFTVQAKFSMELGAVLSKVKSEAYLTIKKTLDEQNIKLSSPTSIQIENPSLPQ